MRPEYFIATKLEAFKGRGKKDGRTSSDFEDIIYVLNNRSTIWEECMQTDNELLVYLKESFSELSQNPYLEEWVMSNLEFFEKGRTDYITGGINKFVKL